MDGSLTASISSSDILEYTYDERGYVESVEKNNSHKVSLVYDGNGNLTLLKELTSGGYTPDNVTSYTYDARGLLTEVYSGGTRAFQVSSYNRNGYSILSETTEDGELLVSYVSRADGLLEQATDGAGNVTKYQYNQQKQVIGLTITAADGSVLYRENNTYNKNGSLVAQSISGEGYDSENLTYIYDSLDRLLSETKNGQTTRYTYDSMGNRLTKTEGGVTTSYVYDLCNKLLSETTSGVETTYVYDALGNLTEKVSSEGTTTYAYDALNQLVEVVNPDGIWQRNTYDASGIRSMIAENGVTTEFMTFNGLVLSGYNKNGEQTEHCYYGNSLLTTEYTEYATDSYGEVTAETSLYYYLKNSHGDVIGLTDSNGTLAETYRYDAFGTLTSIQSLNENGVMVEVETALSRFLYAGEQLDAATGLYYLRARQYDTVIGRFIQEDTYLGDGRNLYVYVGNNPLKYADPSGHCEKNLEYDTTERINQYYLDMTASADPEEYIKYQEEHKTWFEFWDGVENVTEYTTTYMVERAVYSIGARYDFVFGFGDGVMSGFTQKIPDNKTYFFSETEYDKGLATGNLAVLLGDAMTTGISTLGAGALGIATGVEIVGGGYVLAPVTGVGSVALAGTAMFYGNRTRKDADRLSDSVSELLSGLNKLNARKYTYENGVYEAADYHSGTTTGKKDRHQKMDSLH